MPLLLTGPDHHQVWVFPQEIVTLSMPHRTEHYGKGVHCIINTVDGKFIAVVEHCGDIAKRIKEGSCR
jgi:hypothetical protein